MARGRPRKGASPATAFERTVRNARLTLAGQPPAERKPARYPTDGTAADKFLYKRERFVENFPGRLRQLDERFHLLVKMANGELYKFSAKESKRLVAHIRAWAHTIEESFERRRVLAPMDLPTVSLESTEAVMRELAPELLDPTEPPLPDDPDLRRLW